MRRKINVKKTQIIISLIVILIYIIWVFSLNESRIPEGYGITIFLPIVYIFVFAFVLWRPLNDNRTPFIVVYCAMQFMRFIVLSIAALNSFSAGETNIFGRGNYSAQYLTISGVLMIYELVITSFVINLSSRKNHGFENSDSLYLTYNSGIYFLCFICSLFLLVAFPTAKSGLTFFLTYDTEGDVDTLSTLTLLIREFFVTSKYFLLFAVIKFFHDKIEKEQSNVSNRQKLLPLIVILAVCLAVVGLRIGTNRKRIIADAIACILIVNTMFPKYKKQIISFFGVLCVGLVVSTSVFRGATESFSTFSGDLFSPASLQSYLCGQYNISCALKTADIYGNEIGLGTFVLTTLRSCFGIGTVLSGFEFNTLKHYYNQVSSIGYSYLRESQIIPMVGEGAIYFTVLFAPLISAFIVYLGVCIDRIYVKTSRLEYRFMCAVLGVYVGQALSLSSNIVANNITYKLAIFLPIVLIANKVVIYRR